MWQYNYTDELYHFGVKGMKWGQRKAQSTTTSSQLRSSKAAYDSAKSAYKDAKTQRTRAKVNYKNSFNNAYNNASSAYSLSKGRRLANADRWNDAVSKADTYNKANSAFKDSKKAYKQAKKDYKNELKKDNADGAKINRFVYTEGTVRTANKLIAKGVNVNDANKRAKAQAWINTAVLAGASGAYLYAMYKH